MRNLFILIGASEDLYMRREEEGISLMNPGSIAWVGVERGDYSSSFVTFENGSTPTTNRDS